MSISVILPSYQEADNLNKVLPSLKKVLEELNIPHEIVVVDTMESMDTTESVCQNFKVRYVRRRNGNLYGDAIRTGIQDAKYDRIVVMDADGSHNPEEIRNFYENFQKYNYDLIIGSRYISGGNSHNSVILKMMSYMVNLVYRVIFNLNIKDVSDSYRMYNASKLKSVELECNNFDIVEEILIKLKLRYPKLSIKELPIYFNKRLYGESKRDLVKFVVSYIGTIIKLYKIQLKEKTGSRL